MSNYEELLKYLKDQVHDHEPTVESFGNYVAINTAATIDIYSLSTIEENFRLIYCGMVAGGYIFRVIT